MLIPSPGLEASDLSPALTTCMKQGCSWTDTCRRGGTHIWMDLGVPSLVHADGFLANLNTTMVRCGSSFLPQVCIIQHCQAFAAAGASWTGAARERVPMLPSSPWYCGTCAGASAEHTCQCLMHYRTCLH